MKSYFTDYDMYLYGQGTHYEIYKKFGVHPWKFGGKSGFVFDVWAPHAKAVSLIGEFNDWNEEADYMIRLEPTEVGVFECFLPQAKIGQMYKYVIHTADGRKLYKADPFAVTCELRPGTASVIGLRDSYQWTDQKWIHMNSQ